MRTSIPNNSPLKPNRTYKSWSYLSGLAKEYLYIQKTLDTKLVYGGEEIIQDTRTPHQIEITNEISSNLYPFMSLLANRLLNGKGFRIKKGGNIISLKRSSVPLDDLVQEGMYMVIKCIGKYDPKKGAFSTHIALNASSAMHRSANKYDIVTVPTYMRTIAVKALRNYKRVKTINEIVSYIPLKKLKKKGKEPNEMHPTQIAYLIYTTVASRWINIDRPASRIDESDMRDKYSDKFIKSEEETDKPYDIKEVSRYIRAVIKTLTPKEQKVLGLRFGIGKYNEHTLKETGDELTITLERVRQIEAKALRKLKHPLRLRFLTKAFYEKQVVDDKENKINKVSFIRL